MKLDKLIAPEDAERVRSAVSAAEQRTSAELKVIVTRFCWGILEDKARHVFIKENLHRTAERNGVLILIVAANREFVVIGDQGINERVKENFWKDVRDLMQAEFRAERIADGLCDGIERLGTKLSELFPCKPDDRNEIPDHVAIDGPDPAPGTDLR